MIKSIQAVKYYFSKYSKSLLLEKYQWTIGTVWVVQSKKCIPVKAILLLIIYFPLKSYTFMFHYKLNYYLFIYFFNVY